MRSSADANIQPRLDSRRTREVSSSLPLNTSATNYRPGFGRWIPGTTAPAFSESALAALLQTIRERIWILRENDHGPLGVAVGGSLETAESSKGADCVGVLPPLYPEWLGSRAFLEAHRVRFAYIAGEMATGIASPAMVIAMARAGMLGFYGAAGQSLTEIERCIHEIEHALGTTDTAPAWGANLIHSPNEPALERATVELFLKCRVKRVSASAFMNLTPNVVRYACTGLRRDPSAKGGVRREFSVFAKVSRPEVASPFMRPAPKAMLDELVRQGQLTRESADLALELPVATDITVEADSGGHTDNRPLTALLPVMLALRDSIAIEHPHRSPIRIGAAGGLGTPSAVAAAFALGADYVLTGSINQSAVEAGTSSEVKRLLAQTGLADVMMAPAADMFELGVKVQVLKRGTMFPVRAGKLHEVFKSYPGIEAIPAAVRGSLEKEIFRKGLDEVWTSTREYWLKRDPAEVAQAETDPKHRMALCFRAYLGGSSRWARSGDPDRRLDYQIWCGPGMGAFNTWVAGSFLEKLENRSVVQIARNLLEGAAAVTRAQQARSYGVDVPAKAFDFRPRPLE
jgi:trans-AT polyketide synthase/acyltransferase/oxidoreductase domain-containing protein